MIENMQPGRVLDSLVAEKVMGWHVSLGPYSGREFWTNENGGSPYAVSDFRPSSDISAAWKVVERLVNEGAEVNIGCWLKWDCSIDYMMTNWHAEAESAPHAICLAALLALKEEDAE